MTAHAVAISNKNPIEAMLATAAIDKPPPVMNAAGLLNGLTEGLDGAIH